MDTRNSKVCFITFNELISITNASGCATERLQTPCVIRVEPFPTCPWIASTRKIWKKPDDIGTMYILCRPSMMTQGKVQYFDRQWCRIERLCEIIDGPHHIIWVLKYIKNHFHSVFSKYFVSYTVKSRALTRVLKSCF